MEQTNVDTSTPLSTTNFLMRTTCLRRINEERKQETLKWNI